ncbi:MAG: hypothetical protein A2V77_24970 [Anaeromyxobacter sp. RBG_16_69_14]|nr:MAG: hypothetical protein A2V77_24970 [Anaeromyxobacter sp. RBG_16_69_14]
MNAPSLPEAWEIEEMNRMRRIPESEVGERATIPLVPPTDPTPDARSPGAGPRVIVIELW